MNKLEKTASGPAWNIETRRVNELIPSARNARMHSQEQVEQIAKSRPQLAKADTHSRAHPLAKRVERIIDRSMIGSAA